MVGRCSFGEIIDRELGDLVPRASDSYEHVNLSVDTGKAFLYVRYNAQLTKWDVDELGLGHIDAERPGGPDSTELEAIGAALGQLVDRQHLGPFVPPAVGSSRIA